MPFRICFTFVALAAVAVYGGDRGGAVATIGGRAVSRGDLPPGNQFRLLQARTAEYEAERQLVENYLDATLLSMEAERRGVTVERLLAEEVDAKVASVTPAEVQEAYGTLSGPASKLPPEEALSGLRRSMLEVRKKERRAEFLAALRRRENARVLLEPPRIDVSGMPDVPAIGAKSAPVTVMEIGDFQCPYCQRAERDLQAIRARYGDRVRMVWVDLPLSAIHREADAIAEVGVCAGEQGKFWAVRDALLSREELATRSSAIAAADEARVDMTALNACVESGRAKQTLARIREYVRGLGVAATPTILVNGRLATMPLSFESLSRMVDEELARSANGAEEQE